MEKLMISIALVRQIAPARWATIFFALCGVFASVSANACPEGTVFSAFNGRGICAVIGQGAEVAAICIPALPGQRCPNSAYEFHHKNSDPTHSYCCPTMVKDPAGCAQQCAPLKTSVKPQAEAIRVYENCFVLCRNPNGFTTCPDGHKVHAGQPCS